MGVQTEFPAPRRILLVDDVELTRLITEAVLKGATFEVDSVADGADAMLALESKAYDLILMDLDMPGLDGHATAQAIRNRDAGDHLVSPRVVALTALDGQDARERSRRVGMADHIRRPIGPRELVAEVQRVLIPTAQDPAIWRRDVYDDLVKRLGHVRMRQFLVGLLAQCERIRALAAGDHAPMADIKRQAHDLVSVGGMLGFDALSRACGAVQSVDGAVPAGALSRMAVALDRCMEILRVHLSDSPVEAAA